MSGVITRGSQFAKVRDRTSAPDPGGGDRSSGTDPVLTRHPAPRETRRDFRPIRSASGGVRATRRLRLRHTPRPPALAYSLEIPAQKAKDAPSWRTRLSRFRRGLLFATTLEVVRAEQTSNRKLGFGSLGRLDDPSWDAQNSDFDP